MKLKRMSSFVVIAVMLVMCSALLFACGGATVTVDSPTELSITNRELSWKEVEGATYKVSVDGVKYVDAGKATKISLVELVNSTDIKKLYVKAVKGSAESAAAELDVNVSRLGTPTKPTVETNSLSHFQEFKWTPVEGVNKYLVSVNDGKWIAHAKTNYIPSSTGDYKIKVKSAGFSKATTIYLDSVASEESAVIEYIEGPTVTVSKANEIAWSGAVEADSYNVYINGQKVKEGVTSPLNLVAGDTPVISKTGEYYVQIEGITGGKSSFSNLLEGVGTTNINKDEIYSFDNRVCNVSLPKNNKEISNAQFYGDSGYSLKITNGIQLNLVRYAEDVNKVDFRHIKAISYMVYVESVEGDYTFDYVKPEALLGVKTDVPNKAYFGKNKNVPLRTWTKMTIPASNENDVVLILYSHADGAFAWPDEKAHGITYYIDDIIIEEYDDHFASDFTKELKYDANGMAAGSWFGSLATKVDFGDEFASKTVQITGKIAGNAKTDGNTISIGVFKTLNHYAANANITTITVPNAKASSRDWVEIVFDLTLDESGSCYLAAGNMADENKYVFTLFLKDLEALAYSKTVTGETNKSAYISNAFLGHY